MHGIMSSDAPAIPSPSYTSTLARLVRGAFVAMLVLVALAAWLVGQTYALLVFSLPLTAAVMLIGRLWSAVRRRIVYGFVVRPIRREYRKYAWQFLLRAATYAASVACLWMAVPRSVLSRGELLMAMLLFSWTPAGLLVLLQLFPARHVSRSVNLLHALALAFLGLQLFQVYVASRFSEPIVLAPPFRGEWVVFQGGRSSLINHHYFLRSQRFALDMIALEDGTPMQGDPLALESYACFDQPLYAPASGTVAKVVDGRPDMAIGTTDAELPVGNHIVIDVGGERFVLLAHLKQGSVVVEEGREVEAGDLIARCGNSGNTSEPHLHIQIQSQAEFDARGLRTYPIRFVGATLVRGGREYDEQQGELRRNDRVIEPNDHGESHTLAATTGDE
jgi:hypothetical protein